MCAYMVHPHPLKRGCEGYLIFIENIRQTLLFSLKIQTFWFICILLKIQMIANILLFSRFYKVWN